MKIPPNSLKISQLKLTSRGELMARLELNELVNSSLPTLKRLGNTLRGAGGSASSVDDIAGQIVKHARQSILKVESDTGLSACSLSRSSGSIQPVPTCSEV